MTEVKDVAQFENEVLKNSKLVLVDFFATWCGPCRTVAPIVEKVAEEKKETLAVFKVDIDQFNDLAAQYMVQAVPTLLLLKDGKEVDRKVGVLSKGDLKKWIESKE